MLVIGAAGYTELSWRAMALGRHDAVLLVAHGTVTDLDDLPAFLSRIRHGRPASDELVQEMRRRYEAVGGSPLLDITRAQATAVARVLDIPAFTAMRLWHPTVEDVLCGIDRLGLSRIAIVPLAPFSIDVYYKAALASLESVRAELVSPPTFVSIEPFGTAPEFVAAHADNVRKALVCDDVDAELLFTAHSLPTRVIQAGDQYETLFRNCAAAVGGALGRPYHVAFQSQGADGGDWLGPDLKSVMEELAGRGVRRVVLSPVGFVAEHVETLYDLDVEAMGWAKELGLSLTRVGALNTDPGLVNALANRAKAALS
jgi:ferrochelatase